MKLTTEDLLRMSDEECDRYDQAHNIDTEAWDNLLDITPLHWQRIIDPPTHKKAPEHSEA